MYTCLIVILPLISSSARPSTTQQLLDEALKKQQQAYQHVQNQLDKLKAIEQESKTLRFSLNNKGLIKSVEFSVMPDYHDWPTNSQFVRSQDYTIELNFKLSEHNQKLQEQFKKWLSQGWFIEHSETMSLTEEDGSKMQIRLVK